MMSTIGIIYAISEVAGNNCFNLVRDLAPMDVEVIAFSDPQVSVFKNAALIEDQEEKINVIAHALYRGIEQLAEHGATVIILAANSVHIAFDRLSEIVKKQFPSIEILSIVDAVTKECKKYSSVAIFGSNATIKSRMYHKKLENENITIKPFTDDEQAVIHKLISSGYTENTIPSNIRTKIKGVCKNARKDGCDAVVLACTELPMLLVEEDYAGLVYIDSNKILAEYAIENICKIHENYSMKFR